MATVPFSLEGSRWIHEARDWCDTCGANTGQERDKYNELGLNVVWVEPIPQIFKQLQENISRFEKQFAIQALVTDTVAKPHVFHVASNGGQSSSIFELKRHRDIWPEVEFVDSLTLNSTTLDSLILDNDIELSKFDTLVIDTQGSELLVLNGASSVLSHLRFVKTEVADFESYTGCCQLKDVAKFMHDVGFHEIRRVKFADHPTGGGYFDVVYERAGEKAIQPKSKKGKQKKLTVYRSKEFRHTWLHDAKSSSQD